MRILIILVLVIGAGYYMYRRHIREQGNAPAGANTGRSPGSAGRQTGNRPRVPSPRANITETGPMIYYANDRHGQRDKEYRFNFKKVGDSWRAYILRTPNFGGRSMDSATIHRLHDTEGYYICWDRSVATLKDMQSISRKWADSIQEYIATGSAFR